MQSGNKECLIKMSQMMILILDPKVNELIQSVDTPKDLSRQTSPEEATRTTHGTG